MNNEDREQLPGGSHRLMFEDRPESKQPLRSLARFRRRLPTLQGIAEFWKPTQCLMCRCIRLAIALLIGALLGWYAVVAALVVSIYFGFRKEPNA